MPIPDVTGFTDEHVDGAEARRLHRQFEDVAMGENKILVMIASLMLVFTIQYPEIDADELNDGIHGASEWIAFYLSGLKQQKGLPKEKMN
jgi:hypothetical protein